MFQAKMPKSYYFQRIMGCWQNLKSPSLNFSLYQHFNKKTIYDTLKIVACKMWNGVAILLGDGRWTPKLWGIHLHSTKCKEPQ